MGTEKQKEGLYYIEKAAESYNHDGALYYLTLYYYNGNTLLDIPKCSTQEYKKRLHNACDAGSPDALYLRGHEYLNGNNGYDKNPKKALQDFLKAGKEYNHEDALLSAGA